MSLDATYGEIRDFLMGLALGLDVGIPVLDFDLEEDPEALSHPNGYALARVSFGGSRQRGSRQGPTQRFQGVGSLVLLVFLPFGVGTGKLDKLRDGFEEALRGPHPTLPLHVRDFYQDETGRLERLRKDRYDLTAVFERHYTR